MEELLGAATPVVFPWPCQGTQRRRDEKLGNASKPPVLKKKTASCHHLALSIRAKIRSLASGRRGRQTGCPVSKVLLNAIITLEAVLDSSQRHSK
jgi:hypothetical protein